MCLTARGTPSVVAHRAALCVVWHKHYSRCCSCCCGQDTGTDTALLHRHLHPSQSHAVMGVHVGNVTVAVHRPSTCCRCCWWWCGCGCVEPQLLHPVELAHQEAGAPAGCDVTLQLAAAAALHTDRGAGGLLHRRCCCCCNRGCAKSICKAVGCTARAPRSCCCCCTALRLACTAATVAAGCDVRDGQHGKEALPLLVSHKVQHHERAAGLVSCCCCCWLWGAVRAGGRASLDTKQESTAQHSTAQRGHC
jgi:hypothetical protein